MLRKMSSTKIITTPEELLSVTNMDSLKHKLLKYQELLGELQFILKRRIVPSIPNISTFLIKQSLHNVDKRGLTFFMKKFNLNNNDIPHVLGMKIDIKSFLFTSRQLIDQQLLILNSLGDVAQNDSGKDQFGRELSQFIQNLYSNKYPHIKPILREYFLSHTFELVYLRFIRNSIKTIGDLKAEMTYFPGNTEINIVVKADYRIGDKLLPHLNHTEEKIEIFNFRLVETFTKTLDLFALYNNLVIDLLVEQAKKMNPNSVVELSTP